MSYFDPFPIIDYPMNGSNIQTVNFLKRTAIVQRVQRQTEAFQRYRPGMSDRPDTVASVVYGESDLFWLVLYANNIINPVKEWTMDNDSFMKFVKKQYPGTAIFLESPEENSSSSSGSSVDTSFVIGETVTFNTALTGIIHHYDPTLRLVVVTGIPDDYNLETLTTINDQNIGRIVRQWYNAVRFFENNVTGNDGETVHPNLVLDSYDYIDDYISGTSDFAVSNLEFERRKNEERESIRLIQSEFVGGVRQLHKDLIQQ